MSLIAPGVCRHCGCTEDSEHRLADGDTCVWLDRERTVCSNPACIKAESARKAAVQAAARAANPRKKYAGWGYGAIVDDLRKRSRERSKKGKAA